MNSLNTTYQDWVRYTLKSNKIGSLLIDEPIGWKTDQKELIRNPKYNGIYTKISNNLIFVGDAYDYIETVYRVYGINETLTLKKEERNPETFEWEVSYIGYLDLSTYSKEDKKISLKFNSGGLEQILKSRENDEFEIDRLTTISGKPLSELETLNLKMHGRRIFLDSEWETNQDIDSIRLDYGSSTGLVRGDSVGIPMNLFKKSHEEAQSILAAAHGNQDRGSAGMFLLANCENDKTLNINLKFKVTTDVRYNQIRLNSDNKFQICLTTFDTEANNYTALDRKVMMGLYNNMRALGSSQTIDLSLGIFPNLGGFIPPQTWNCSFTGQITLLKGQSLGIDALYFAELFRFVVDIKNIEIEKCQITEDSFFEETTTKTILAHEVADRLITISTNNSGNFYSEFLGRTDIGYSDNGPGSYASFSNGFWIRGFDKLPIPSEVPKVENLYKPMKMSFNAFFESIDAVYNVGLGIERYGFRERIRLEKLDYFYNRNVTIKLPNKVSNVKRTAATEYYFSSLEFGNEKGGNYEEAFGLDEPNGITKYNTIIDRVKNSYSKISNARLDSYGSEFARRKQKFNYPFLDTKYDEDVFMFDTKKVGDDLELKKWQDDFEKEPTGIFSPETAFNLLFSPVNCLLRHSAWFSAGLKQYASDFIRYASSTANSQLKTKLKTSSGGDGYEYSEKEDILNSRLNKSRVFPEWVEFDHVCDFSIMKQVEGNSIINGKKIPNIYGLIEFINEDGELERGFLFSLKPNGDGRFKLLTFNR